MNLHQVSFLVLIVGLILLTCAPLGQLTKLVKIVTVVAGVIWFLIDVFGAVPLR